LANQVAYKIEQTLSIQYRGYLFLILLYDSCPKMCSLRATAYYSHSSSLPKLEVISSTSIIGCPPGVDIW